MVDQLVKTEQLLKAVRHTPAGAFFYPPLAISHRDGQNAHGREQKACVGCAACCTGCPETAKNTLDFNYLPAAHRRGAEIQCRHEVKAFEPYAGGFRIHVLDHSRGGERRTIVGKRLVLAAGALGTPYLLLKNRAAFPALSPRLGSRFTGNGDFLTFAARCRRVLEPAFGPVITSAVRVHDQRGVDPRDDRPGFYVQDSGYPAFCAWIGEMIASPRIVWAEKLVLLKLAWKYLIGRPERNLSYELSQLFGDGRLSASTLPLLGIGREPAQGQMRLVDGRLDIDWSFRRARPYFEQVKTQMREITRGLGGTFEDNFLWRLSTVITVHPLGGCPMGRTAADGVVDPDNGQVHNYPGLHVADGSVMPGAVGPNPSLTIAAVADRFADAILAEEPR
jgi:cholesterol oxidase